MLVPLFKKQDYKNLLHDLLPNTRSRNDKLDDQLQRGLSFATIFWYIDDAFKCQSMNHYESMENGHAQITDTVPDSEANSDILKKMCIEKMDTSNINRIAQTKTDYAIELHSYTFLKPLQRDFYSSQDSIQLKC